MEVLKGKDDLCSVEPRVGLAERIGSTQSYARDHHPMPQYQRIQGIKSSLGGVFVQGLLYLGTYLKRPIFLKCENISPPGTYSSIMYRLELSCNDMYCLVSCLWDNIAIGFRPTQLSMHFLNVFSQVCLAL